MKIVFVLLMFLCFSCKEKKNVWERIAEIDKAAEQKRKHVDDSVKTVANKVKDTAIYQEVGFYKGIYFLQTWITINKKQFPQCCKHANTRVSQYYRDLNGQLWYPGSEKYNYSPYCKEIVGSFNYIKEYKVHEFKVAEGVLSQLIANSIQKVAADKRDAEIAKRAQDSVNILNSIK